MPQFRFRIQDKEGRIRSGKMAATSRLDAHNRIEQSGMKVVELTEVFDSEVAPALKVQSGTKSTYRASRADPYELNDGILQRLRSKFPASLSPNAVCAALAVIGLLYLVWSWQAEKTSSKKVVAEATRVPTNVTVLGTLSVEGVQDLGDVQMVMDFPEIPYQVSKKWSELEHPSQARFKWEAQFTVRNSPHQCFVRAIKPRYDEAVSSPLNLATNQLSYNVALSLKPETAKPRPVKRATP